MKIKNVGYNWKHPLGFCVDEPHGREFYIFLVVRTAAYFVLNGEKCTAEPYSIICFKPGTPLLYGGADVPFVNDWLHFVPTPQEQEQIDRLEIPMNMPLPMESITEFSDLIKQIFVEKYSNDNYNEEVTQLYFYLLFFKLAQRLRISGTEKESPYYRQFMSLRSQIYSTPEKEWNIDDISREMNVSRSYLHHLYKAFFGTSIINDVTESRLKYAKYLLPSTDLTIGNIAQLCGYRNEVYFMRIFKKREGITPSQFRSRHCGGAENSELSSRIKAYTL